MPFSLESILKKQFILFLISVFAIPIILIVFFLVLPANNKIGSLKMELSDAQSNLDKKLTEVQELNQSINIINTLSTADIGKLNEMLPDNKDTEGLLQILEDKSLENGFVLKTIDISDVPQSEVLPSKVNFLKVAANFAGGDFKSFENLLRALEMNARLFDVSSVNFAAGSGAYALNFKAYWLPQIIGAPLKIDSKFFDEPLFKSLVVSRAELKAEPKGKENPFAVKK